MCGWTTRGNGRPALYRVTTAGDDGEILRRNGEEDIVAEVIPFAAMTPSSSRIDSPAGPWPISSWTSSASRLRSCAAHSTISTCTTIRASRWPRCASETTLDDSGVPAGRHRADQAAGRVDWQVARHHRIGLPGAAIFRRHPRMGTGVSRQGVVDPNALQNCGRHHREPDVWTPRRPRPNLLHEYLQRPASATCSRFSTA